MKHGKTILIAVVTIIGIGITISTMGPVVGQKFTPSLHSLDAQMATEGGKIITITALSQIGLLILVLRRSYGTVKSVLFGVAAGALLVFPLALKELNSTLEKAIMERSYRIVADTPDSNGGPVTYSKLIVGSKELLLPQEIITTLKEKFPPTSK